MTDVNINDFVDFSGLFKALCSKNEEMMQEVIEDVGDETYENILRLKDSEMVDYIDITECEIDDSRIVFVLSLSDNNANESDTQESGTVCNIVYDRALENFDNFSLENY
ncbi:hypothetical protein ACOHYD_13880 [Desulfobacterota bacterium M19]